MKIEVAVIFLVLGIVLLANGSQADDEASQTCRYDRPVGSEYQLESQITLQQHEGGYTVASTTLRGRTRLSLLSDFDRAGRLKKARVTVISGDQQQTAEAVGTANAVEVKRASGLTEVFDCPPGVIVTSAPDWTDTLMVTRRYDEQKGGEQQFAGLWIHPTRRPLRLSFRVRRTGTDTVALRGEHHQLERLSIVLRNESRYVAWRNGKRQLVRLVADGQAQPAIVLQGWQAATSRLIAN